MHTNRRRIRPTTTRRRTALLDARKNVKYALVSLLAALPPCITSMLLEADQQAKKEHDRDSLQSSGLPWVSLLVFSMQPLLVLSASSFRLVFPSLVSSSAIICILLFACIVPDTRYLHAKPLGGPCHCCRLTMHRIPFWQTREREIIIDNRINRVLPPLDLSVGLSSTFSTSPSTVQIIAASYMDRKPFTPHDDSTAVRR